MRLEAQGLFFGGTSFLGGESLSTKEPTNKLVLVGDRISIVKSARIYDHRSSQMGKGEFAIFDFLCRLGYVDMSKSPLPAPLWVNFLQFFLPQINSRLEFFE